MLISENVIILTWLIQTEIRRPFLDIIFENKNDINFT